MTEEDVRKAVELAKMRDDQAITKLYEEYHNSVYFLCLRIVRDKDEAFDLVQNSFLAAFDKLNSLQKPECFGSWLHQIAANQCKNHLKKKKPLLFSEKPGDENGIPEEFDIEDRDESLIPDQALDTGETRRLLMEIIDGLPDLQRMTVMLYYYEEQSIKEISVTMDCSENTVKSRLNYARKQIKAGVEGLEKKGTKLHGVFPMLFPLIRHAAADTSVPPEASSLMLKHIASSVNQNGATWMNEISFPKNTPTGPKAPLHEHLWSTARNIAGKFSAMSLPAKIGSAAAVFAVIAGVTVGVVAAVHADSSTPVSCKVSSQMPSSKLQKGITSSAPVTSAVSAAASSAPAVTKIQVALGVAAEGLPICKSSVKASHPNEAVLSGLTVKLMDVNKTTVYSTHVISDADLLQDFYNGGTSAFLMAVPEWKDGSTYVLVFSTVPNEIKKPADAKIVYSTGLLDTDSSGTVTKVIGVYSPVCVTVETVKTEW